jgi:prepilin-type N-terminal cleavage/methylation domain-containing protein
MSRNQTSCQLPVAGCQSSTRRAAYCRLPAADHRRGFTLTEILVVVGIIVLILAMAVPAFNFITGSRSLEAAQNNVSAMLGRARAQAIYTGQSVGVAIYDDAQTRRYTMALVQFDATPAGTQNIDLSPDQDPQVLQPGTGARGVLGNSTYPTPAVVFFDAQGRLVNIPYVIKANGNLDLAIYKPATSPWQWANAGNSQLGLILYDRPAFENQTGAEATYLNANGLLLVINRYNGTILRSE